MNYAGEGPFEVKMNKELQLEDLLRLISLGKGNGNVPQNYLTIYIFSG